MAISHLGEEVSSPTQEACRVKAQEATVKKRIPTLVGGGGNGL